MYYQKNRLRAITQNNEPTMTDQAGARDTDINVIVAQFARTGQVPGGRNEPMYGDFSVLPRDLRGFIQEAASLERHRRNLPEQLRNMSLPELLSLTPDKLKDILTPAPTPVPTEEKK